MHVLMTPEGKRVVIEPLSDLKLYDSPNNPPNTGQAYTRGTDLYVHKARSGNLYYYLYSWSMWQGEEEDYRLVTPDEARDFLLACAGYSGHAELTDDELTLAEEYFPGIFEEDA
jgi:hypothetical protein